MGSVFFCFGVAILPHVQYGRYYVTVFWGTVMGDSGLVCFHYNTKHQAVESLHMCTVVLWTKVVIGFMLL